MNVNETNMILKIFFLFGLLVGVKSVSNYSFPSNFVFGTATAAYQVEGGWNVGGKGLSIWDYFVHNNPELIIDRSTGDVTCDSYHRYEDDVALLKNLGVQFYRFSISWTRILPNGRTAYPNADGIEYYNNLINLLITNNIIPMITIYHFDLPYDLHKLGGWTNPLIVNWFTEYARVLFDNYADRVKYWITFNEPFQFCQLGYGDVLHAPFMNMSGIADYLCNHNFIKSHAAVYHLFNDSYRKVNNGSIGLSVSGQWREPNSTKDIDAAERILQFHIGMYAHPIYIGDYPEVVKEYVGKISAAQGYPVSRLPEFTPEEIEYIRGTADFFGLNHYSSHMVVENALDINVTSFVVDQQFSEFNSPDWKLDPVGRFGIVPWGFRKMLNWIKDRYNNPIVHITENGCPDHGDTNDVVRVSYYGQYLEALLQAIHEDGVNVRSFNAWTLMDNFEWIFGYTYSYGLHYVNFTDSARPRTPKLSANFLKKVIETRVVGDYPILS